MVPVAVSVAMPAALGLLDRRRVRGWVACGLRLDCRWLSWRLLRTGRRLVVRVGCRGGSRWLLTVRARLRPWVDDRIARRLAVLEGEHVPMPHELVVVVQAVRAGCARRQEEGHDRQERRQGNEGRDDDETLHETSKGEKSRPPFRR